MELNEFIRIYLDTREGEIVRYFVGGLPWDHWKYLVSMTRDIDFGCDFQHGKCIKHRSRCGGGGDPRKCCCSRCAVEVGYFSKIKPKDIPMLAELYDKEDGFWREGLGCTLPADTRSVVCVRYRCIFAKDNRPMINHWHRYVHHVVLHVEDLVDRYKVWYLKKMKMKTLEFSSVKRCFIPFLDRDFMEWRMSLEMGKRE